MIRSAGRFATKIIVLYFVVSLFHKQSFSQSFPAQLSIQNFTRFQYLAGSQNWAIEQDKQGRIYFANNEGLLIYDGHSWQIFPIPNKTIVRFICYGKDGKLYAGGQDELGYYTPDKTGKLVFVSLLGLIDSQDKEFADIWNIVSFGEDIFFRSFSRIFRLHNGSISVYRAAAKWDFLGIHQGRLIAQDKGRGIVVYNNNNWESLINLASLPEEFSITSLASFNNESILTTTKSGLFKLSGNHISPFKITGNEIINNQFFTSSQVIDNGELLLGTYENGLIHSDSTGNLIETFTKNEGLSNNNIKSIFKDDFGNIWLGLEDGISFLDFKNPIKLFSPKIFNGASGYATALFNNNFFFALSNGIYQMPFSKNADDLFKTNEIKKISEGLSWKISTIGDHLFAGREDGLFEIKENALFPIDRSTGFWGGTSFPGNNKRLSFAVGNYLGVSFFEELNESIIKEKDLTHLNTSCRFIEYDSALQVIWVSHPYRGIYKISLSRNNDDVTLYTSKNGLPSDLNNHVFKIANQILIATINGVYTYNKQSDRFELSKYYDDIFHGISLRYLQDDTSGNLWFVSDKNVGIVECKSHSIIYLPELQRKILSGFENIYPVDSSYVIIGGEQGFFNVNYKKYLQLQTEPQVYIRNVASKNLKDSILYGGYSGKENTIGTNLIKLPYQWNSFHFEYSSTFHELPANFEYSYQLKGFDAAWSEWSKKAEKDYTNIPPGRYTFNVKARNNLNRVSGIASYSFEILPPWYSTIWAWLIYVLSFVLFLYWLAKKQERRISIKKEKKLKEQQLKYEEEQKVLAYQHQLQLEKTERELMQVKNEKLESEIEFQNSELALTAMNLVQKKEFLLKIKEELNKLLKPGHENFESTELKKIIRSLTSEDRLDEEWQQFSTHFNKIHGDFLIMLRNKYPVLKAHDLKLCAYLRMNLTSKQMAQLMSISVRGVEIGRYRLRKKLQVSPKEDLFQFLINLEAANTQPEQNNKNALPE